MNEYDEYVDTIADASREALEAVWDVFGTPPDEYKREAFSGARVAAEQAVKRLPAHSLAFDSQDEDAFKRGMVFGVAYVAAVEHAKAFI